MHLKLGHYQHIKKLGNVRKKCYFGHVACLIASGVANVPRVLMQDKPAYIIFFNRRRTR